MPEERGLAENHYFIIGDAYFPFVNGLWALLMVDTTISNQAFSHNRCSIFQVTKKQKIQMQVFDKRIVLERTTLEPKLRFR